MRVLTTKRKIQLGIFILFLLLLTFKGLLWLAVGISIITAICLLYYSKLKFFIWLRNNRFFNPVVVIIFIFVISISARVFFIEIFAIPSGSMENTLIKGDKVLVSKLNYGPALPRSPFDIPWLNLIWYLQANASTKIDSVYWNYSRLKGVSRIKHNDVTVFLHPVKNEKNNFFIKRCTGLPGDTLQIINGMIFVNGKELNNPEQIKHHYKVKVNDRDSFRNNCDRLGMEIMNLYSERKNGRANLNLTKSQFKQLIKQKYVDSIQFSISENDPVNWVYPKNKTFGWTIDNWGPVVIPRKGMTIELNPRNFQIYQRTINLLEKQKIKEKEGIFFLDEECVSTYTFRNNYYFMMGDNRSNSSDSRYWGFVPEEYIIGKALVVLFSKDEEGFKWRRILRVIR